MNYIKPLMHISNEVLKTDELHKLGYLGEGITIAYIDTGVNAHLDFLLSEKRIVKFVDFINQRTEPYDDNGHGTFICGVGSGNGLVSNGVYLGTAPKSKIICLKALESDGDTTSDKVLLAMRWISENYKKYNIKIVSMSFGSEPIAVFDPIMQWAERLWSFGICVVAAAGNSGPEYETIKSPGVSPRIITVGGLNDKRSKQQNDYDIAEFSSRGPAYRMIKPDIVAPGVEVTSCGTSDFYTTLSGTSVATPMIAGLCALYFEKYPNATNNQLKRALISACSPVTFNRYSEGYGLPDAIKFINQGRYHR